MIKFKIIKLSALMILLTAILLPAIGQAAMTISGQDSAFVEAAGLGTQSLSVTIAEFIQWLLGFSAVVFVVLFVYAGFSWLTSAGNEEKIEKAKTTMTAAVIGLVIILAAFIITYFAIDKILEATGSSPTGLD